MVCLFCVFADLQPLSPPGEYALLGPPFLRRAQALDNVEGAKQSRVAMLSAADRPFLLYRQRHVLFSAGRKENVGLERWVLEIDTHWLTVERFRTVVRDGSTVHALLSTGGK